MGTVVTPVMAETDPGRIAYPPEQAIQMTADKIQAAIDAAAAGTQGDELVALIKEALDMSKEINANDQVDVARSRANGVLKKARSATRKGDADAAKASLDDALKAFKDLMKLL